MQFQSGNQTTKGHLAAIIKMALVLKKLTLEGGMLSAGKKEDADEDDEEAFSKIKRHLNDSDWTRFCNGELKRIENRWTKKLEDYRKEDAGKDD